jgi:hypothetical protein
LKPNRSLHGKATFGLEITSNVQIVSAHYKQTPRISKTPPLAASHTTNTTPRRKTIVGAEHKREHLTYHLGRLQIPHLAEKARNHHFLAQDTPQ